ncbi:MAG: retropepsin-like aspartic protease [Gammaproteobacteria bacterium]|jgi:gag-polyprotein putative aspartyl protease
MIRYLLVVLAHLSVVSVSAADFDTPIPMRGKGAATYYVEGHLAGIGPTEFMVDTGSGYLAISQDALDTLLTQQRARYVKDLLGVLANGNEMVVPVYSIDELTIGRRCKLKNVEAAIFPGKNRFILGLSALQKAAPFIFSLDPPTLALSNCSQKTDPAWLTTRKGGL